MSPETAADGAPRPFLRGLRAKRGSSLPVNTNWCLSALRSPSKDLVRTPWPFLQFPGELHNPPHVAREPRWPHKGCALALAARKAGGRARTGWKKAQSLPGKGHLLSTFGSLLFPLTPAAMEQVPKHLGTIPSLNKLSKAQCPRSRPRNCKTKSKFLLPELTGQSANTGDSQRRRRTRALC